MSLFRVPKACKHFALVGQCASSRSFMHTYNCGELSLNHIGMFVSLYGWVDRIRMSHFLLLRDWTGIVQVMIPSSSGVSLNTCYLESVISVQGVVQTRPKNQENLRMPTGSIEVAVEDLKILNSCIEGPRFLPVNADIVEEGSRLKYRYLAMRSSRMQQNLKQRSIFVHLLRKYFVEHAGFVEVETPALTTSTPGGAREFKVQGTPFVLAQSPQIYKQLLMVSGIRRYFQVAKCFRDEGASEWDRQPEFTQIDFEMAFSSSSDVMDMTERLLSYALPGQVSRKSFMSITYYDAVNCYGSDKPDCRFGMNVQDITPIMKNLPHNCANFLEDIFFCLHVKAVVMKQCRDIFSSKQCRHLVASAQTGNAKCRLYKLQETNTWAPPTVPDLMQKRLTKFLGLSSGDVLLIAGGLSGTEVSHALGVARLKARDILREQGRKLYDPDMLSFVWVTDFPLFAMSKRQQLECSHHMFTAPVASQTGLLDTNPLSVTGQHYDLVLNGNEVGGGSVRIHDKHLQKKILENVLQIDTAPFQFLLNALGSGCPPHAGIALGLDRLCSIIYGAKTIRDVIAFPKSTGGNEVLMA